MRVKLKDICDVLNGRAYGDDELLEYGKTKILRVGNFFNNSKYFYSDLQLEDNKYCEYNDLLYCWSASFGAFLCKEKEKCIYHYHIWKLTNFRGINKFYLYYQLVFITEQLKKSTHGSIMMHLTKENFENIEIDLPDRKTQDKIVEILSEIDEQIERNNEIIKRLQVLGNTIYRRWFLQFDFPDAQNKPYRSSGGKMVWNDTLKREIPVDWKNSVIANHIGNYTSGDWGKDTSIGNYQKVVNCIRGTDLSCIEDGGVQNVPTRYILSKHSNKTLLSGALLVEISGGSPIQSTGRICYINNACCSRFDNEIITSNFCKAFYTQNMYEQYWLYLLWKTVYNAGILFCFEGKTTGIKNLLFDDFCNNYPIVYPQEHVLEKFHRLISPIFEQVQQLCRESEMLIKLRNSLLPILINRQLFI